MRHLERVLFETRDVTLRGDFNLEDVLAATTAACVLGADFAAIRKAVRAFQAVEHRLEFVREIQGVDFYNNSKATSVDATLKSLEAFERGVHLIMGGKDKGAPYTPLLPLIKDRVREVLLIGAAAPVIAEQLAGSTELVQAGDLSTAVYEAFARSRPGDTVLLAPACSSFDQFKDYEERGRVFKELVKQLAKEVAAGRAVRTRDTGVRDSRTRDPIGLGVRSCGKSDWGSEVRRLGIRSPEFGIGYAPEARRTTVRFRIRSRQFASSPPEPKPPLEAAERGTVELRCPEARASSPTAGSPSPSPDYPRRDSRTPNPGLEPALPSSEVPVAGLDSRIRSPLTGVPSPEPAEHESDRAPHHLELTYVYEVDAVEMPEVESQVVPEDEPAISISSAGGDPR